MSTEDDDYRSSDDEDYVPEGAVDDDVDEPSGDECDEVRCSMLEHNFTCLGKRSFTDLSPNVMFLMSFLLAISPFSQRNSLYSIPDLQFLSKQ